MLNFNLVGQSQGRRRKQLFSGGFLGLDNIGVSIARSRSRRAAFSSGRCTAWMAFYCLTMLSMALELAESNPVYEDHGVQIFEHFIHIADAMNTIVGTGLWIRRMGFIYDKLKTPAAARFPLRTRSLVGLLP